eukprot:TRINITY_DN9023_c0_g1_i1.p1 TRINITY_DN9023_c0_g1~~TRINITY_DN9023_c0_g1_i1.p1  ORF type:complete len:541 (+),score=80.30 TRINITY_DN9023_c0_g1_i1:52-1623(+)
MNLAGCSLSSLLFLLPCIIFFHSVSSLRAPLDKPNFVVLFADDLGYGDLGFTGHPTTKTPNLDELSTLGMRLTTWYSGYPVCTASRTSLLTGRYYGRSGMPGVIGNAAEGGLPLNETTFAAYLKKSGYKTGIVGKWHLGQREMYLPKNHGFDSYLGIPYSVDMGTMARETPCDGSPTRIVSIDNTQRKDSYLQPFLDIPLPLVTQNVSGTTILEQPLDLTTLVPKYAKYATDFIEENVNDPFLLYVPFSHVHTAANEIVPDKQYASCPFINSTVRGRFGDALAELDWIVGEIVSNLKARSLEKNTLIIFTSDNGPWLMQRLGSGSVGIFSATTSGYWNVGKGSTWEGGIRGPAFVYWPGQVTSGTRTSETVSSMDVLPTLLNLAGIARPSDRIIDGKDFWPIVSKGAQSQWKNDFLYHYWEGQVHAVTHGPYKAHFITAPGLGGCSLITCQTVVHNPPLLFNVQQDPSEAYPLDPSQYKDLLNILINAKNEWVKDFVFGHIPQGSGMEYAVCCNRSNGCVCNK